MAKKKGKEDVHEDAVREEPEGSKGTRKKQGRGKSSIGRIAKREADGGRSGKQKPLLGYQGKCVLNPSGQPRHGKSS